MKRFARALIVLLSLAVIGIVVSLVPQKPAVGAGGAPVSILSPLPLPVTGNVNANITNTTAVPVSGTVTAKVVFPASQSVIMASHLGVNPSQLVTLSQSNAGLSYSWTQINSDGTTNTFELQSGQLLVVTDIEFRVTGNVGDTQGIGLIDGFGNVIWRGPDLTINSFATADGASSLTSGLVMKGTPAVVGFALNTILHGYTTTLQ